MFGLNQPDRKHGTRRATSERNRLGRLRYGGFVELLAGRAYCLDIDMIGDRRHIEKRILGIIPGLEYRVIPIYISLAKLSSGPGHKIVDALTRLEPLVDMIMP